MTQTDLNIYNSYKKEKVTNLLVKMSNNYLTDGFDKWVTLLVIYQSKMLLSDLLVIVSLH